MREAEILQAAEALGPRGHVSFYGEEAREAFQLLSRGLIRGEPARDQVTVLGITEAGAEELRKIRARAEAQTVRGKARAAGRWLLRLLGRWVDLLIGCVIGSLGTLLAQWLWDAFHS